MVPSAFVILDALPRTAHGKVDRKALPTPDSGVLAKHHTLTPPSTPLEGALVRIWREVLEVRGLGVHDNFFDVGGHSLLAMRLVSRITADLTWYPTEFSKLRLQYQHDWLDENFFLASREEDSVILQFEFILGAHGAHKF